MIRVAVLVIAGVVALSGQTATAPVRAVTDPGVVTTRQGITPAGVPTVFQGRVYGVAFGATSSEVFVLGVSHVYRLDWNANKVLEQAAHGGTAGLQGLVYDAESQRALVSGAGKDRKTWVKAFQRGTLTTLSEGDGTHLSGALALSGRVAAAPLIYNNKLAVLNLAGGGGARTFDTGIAPFGVALNAAGTVAYVTNWGGRLPNPKDLTATTGFAPGADRVVVDARGIAATGTVTRIDLTGGGQTRAIAVGLHPTAVVWDEPRNRLYVANANQDSVSVIDTSADRVIRTIEIQPFEQKVKGVAPTALAISPDGGKLWVACGGINAVAQVRTRDGVVEGLIPTAWYPNALSVSRDGRRLAAATLLGVGSGWRDEPKKRFVHSYRGAVHVLDVPDAAQLASYTTAVAENNHLRVGAPRAAVETASSRAAPLPVPRRAGEPSLIEHVVYIIKENRTYDQVFGDMAKGNGDPSLTMFGEEVTPNHHKIADQFVLLDNFYATGGNSGDGHQWLTQANETAYCLWPGYTGRSYPFDGTDPIAYSSGGFIWDLALARKKTVRVYGEYAGRLPEERPEQRVEMLKQWEAGQDFTARWNIRAQIESLNKILATNYPSYTNAIPDVVRASIFKADVARWVKEGSMPNLVVLQLPCDHTFGTRPGTSSPKAMVADNDLAMGQVVEALSQTPFWKKMAIFITEDDAQNGVDHVDGHRTVTMIASPYTRKGSVDSTFYSTQSILKTIELILGLPTLSLFDLIANDMRASFTDQPDFTAYKAEQPKQSLWELNPPLSALRGEDRKAASDSAKMRWDVPDAAPTERLNRILWRAIKGKDVPYPTVRRAVFAPMEIETEDEEREEREELEKRRR